jgi:hypothetical protein
MFSLRAQKSNKIIQSGDIVVIKGNNSPLAKPILTQVLGFYFASRAVNVLFASVALTSALLKSVSILFIEFTVLFKKYFELNSSLNVRVNRYKIFWPITVNTNRASTLLLNLMYQLFLKDLR